jgi:tetratricopeptide (TPR) repeat protein
MKFPKGMMLPVMCLTIASGLAQTAAKPGPSPAARARTLFAEGSKLIDGGDYQTASEKINAGLKLDPNSAVGHFYSAEIEQKWGHMSTAEAEYKMSLKLDPNSKVADQAVAALTQVKTPIVQTQQKPVVPEGPTFEEAAQFVTSRVHTCNIVFPGAIVMETTSAGSFRLTEWAWRENAWSMGRNGNRDEGDPNRYANYSLKPSELSSDVTVSGCQVKLTCSTPGCIHPEDRPAESEATLNFGSEDDASRASKALARMLELSGVKKSAF